MIGAAVAATQVVPPSVDCCQVEAAFQFPEVTVRNSFSGLQLELRVFPGIETVTPEGAAGPQFWSNTVEMVKVPPPAFVKPEVGCFHRGMLSALFIVTVFEVPVRISHPVPVQFSPAIPEL